MAYLITEYIYKKKTCKGIIVKSRHYVKASIDIYLARIFYKSYRNSKLKILIFKINLCINKKQIKLLFSQS